MNIVYIHAHDLGRYCEPMGYPIPSKNLMKLARQGTLFRNTFAAAPSCAPSRGALVSGQYPHCCGMLGLPAPELGYVLNDFGKHIAAHLRRNGFETALSGVEHVAASPWAPPRECLPYDHFLNFESDDKEQFCKVSTASSAVSYLKEKHDKPFFLSVGFLDPHRHNPGDRRTFVVTYPMNEPVDIDDDAKYCLPFPHMPDNPVMRREMANFKTGVEVLDFQVGLVLRALDTPEYRENTLVVFTTDHGPGVAEMKCTLSDRGTGVVMMIRGPRSGPGSEFNGGKVVDAMTQHLDLYPTFCDIAGVPKPDWLNGKSLLPLVNGQADEIHDAVFSEQTYHYSPVPRPFRAVRTKRYKYIRCYDINAPRGSDTGPSEHYWNQFGYNAMPYQAEALYDLVFDPAETNNLADRLGFEEVLTVMRKLLDAWQEQTDDPIRNGEIPVPPAKASSHC